MDIALKLDKKVSTSTALMLGATVIFTYMLMVMGTFVTSTGSGLACPDWPLCYGTVVPPRELSIWFEWGHRLLGGITGILVIVSTILVWKNLKGAPRALTLGVILLLAVGVLLGGITVLIEAPVLSTALHVAIISSHLVIATMVLVCLVFTFGFVRKSTVRAKTKHFKLLFGAVYLQVLIGIVVRYSGATLSCPDLPFCNGQVVPTSANHLVLLHFAHRAVAFFVFSAALVMLVKAVKSRASGGDLKGFLFAFLLITAQAFFGVSIVMSAMFLPFIIMHAATGFLLLGFLAYKSMPHFFAVKSFAPERGV